ncbi:MAG: tRNA uridine(34) 5-carboxymethylaminomethyl modification radical SAM/GNAT enzyme Elp3 [Candidatus Altiarchaeota archaeon]|nr:tRNA uridine(34) 5-carboxymethylaminomethyl modification radical SAM/GNAT enzyme Elp3 [Candidatus Altiarchaeota archaeon]
MKKPRRSLSGVAVIAVMAPAFDCPGECVYCFRGLDAAQSYTGLEPAASRAIRYEYDPEKITSKRIAQLEENGHPTDKLEVIVMGGTFNSFPHSFQKNFVKKIFDACNKQSSASLKKAHELNELAKHRVIGLTFETRPDYAQLGQLNQLLEFGMTRLELGVQTIHDSVLELVKRGHDSSETVRATRDAKDLGLKLVYHIMTGLPGSSPQKDLAAFKQIFSAEQYQPDMLKIYPTLVVPGSELEGWMRKKKYVPPTTEQTIKLLAKAKQLVPPWVRIMRIQRDVPIPATIAGLDKGNLRELVWQEMNTKCRCIRCREALSETELEPEMIERQYQASCATEIFLSWEDKQKDRLIGFLRLRLLTRFIRPELQDSAIVRELRVYGPEARIGQPGVWQHKGLGKKLLVRAEEIATEQGYKQLAVLAGIGVRPYFHKLGYSLAGPYMTKRL